MKLHTPHVSQAAKLSKSCCLVAYKSMVRSNLEYCASVWSPHTEKLKSKLEQVQRRAARYVTNRYHNTSSVSAMLNHLRLKKPMILFAFEVMLLIRVSQFMSFEIVMPRYFAVVGSDMDSV
jgi:hypothetical protein